MALWTRARLERTLRARYGPGPRGGINVRAAAAELEVSTSTIYRWLKTPSPRSKVRLSEDRIAKLESAIGIEKYLLQREKDTADRARWAVEFIRTNGAQTTWAHQLWLEPHLVQVLQSRNGLVRWVVFNRVGELAAKEPRVRRVVVVEQLEVSSRFHAEILVHLVLQKMGRWRVPAKNPDVDVALTRTWTHDGAPAVHLDKLAEALPRPVSQRRRAEARKRRREEEARRAKAAVSQNR